MQVLEQLGHLLGIGAAPVAIVLGFESWGFPGWQIAGGAAASTWVSLIRELVDGWPIGSWGDAALDFAFGVAGGTSIGVVFWAFV